MSRLRALALLASIAVVGVIVVVVVGSRPPARSADPRGTRSSGAAVIKRRNLVLIDTESGTLSYAGSHTVYDRLPGTITWLPAAGQLIRLGGVLYRVDNRPVLLLDGRTPAYRDLRRSDSPGPDILQLNAALVMLGDDPDKIAIDDRWQAATTAGVEALQARWREHRTGELALGAVAFLPGPQLVSAVECPLGDGVSLHEPPPPAEFASLTTTTAVPAWTAILRTTSDHLVVTVDLPAPSQTEAVVGARVAVQLPAGGTIRGRITSVSAVATAPASTNGNGGPSSATVPVRIGLPHLTHRLRLDEAPVSVRFVQSRARHVLSVPVTALIASAGSHYAVQEAAPPHTLLPVRAGLFAAGYVQISGPKITPGLTVTDSQG